MRALHLLALLPSLAFAQGAPEQRPPPPPPAQTPPPGQPAPPQAQAQPREAPEAQQLPPGHPPVEPGQPRGPEGGEPGMPQQPVQLVGPAACVVRALNETMLDDYDAMLLCQGATSSRPVDCFKQTDQHTFMEKHQILTLCSPSLSAGGGLIGYHPASPW